MHVWNHHDSTLLLLLGGSEKPLLLSASHEEERAARMDAAAETRWALAEREAYIDQLHGKIHDCFGSHGGNHHARHGD